MDSTTSALFLLIAGAVVANLALNFYEKFQDRQAEQARYDREFAGIVESYE